MNKLYNEERFKKGGVVLERLHPELSIEPFIPYYEKMGYKVTINKLPNGWTEIIGEKKFAKGGVTAKSDIIDIAIYWLDENEPLQGENYSINSRELSKKLKSGKRDKQTISELMDMLYSNGQNDDTAIELDGYSVAVYGEEGVDDYIRGEDIYYAIDEDKFEKGGEIIDNSYPSKEVIENIKSSDLIDLERQKIELEREMELGILKGNTYEKELSLIKREIRKRKADLTNIFAKGGKTRSLRSIRTDRARLSQEPWEQAYKSKRKGDYYEDGGEIDNNVVYSTPFGIGLTKDFLPARKVSGEVILLSDEEINSGKYPIIDWDKVGEAIEDNAKKFANGGKLKPIPKDNKGLPHLPKEVRNRMGYMEEGGMTEINEDGSNIPPELMAVFDDNYDDDRLGDYVYMEELREKAKEIGYDFDYDLSGTPTEFWKVTPESYAKGGKTKINWSEYYAKGGTIMSKEMQDKLFDADGTRKIDRKSIKELTDYVNSLEQTKSKHFNEKTKKYSPSRQKLHKEILNEFKDNLVCIESDEPIAILMGGSPASGKSTFLRKYAPYLLSEELLRIDADEVRSMLPEYEGWNASQTHLETKDVVNTLLSDRTIGLPCNFDLIYDGTMNNTKSYLPLIKLLKELGYKIFVVYIDNVPKDVITDRALKRYQISGRFVPLEVIDDFFNKGKSALNEIKKQVDGYMIIDGGNKNYEVIEEGGMKLPQNREYSKIGSPIK